MLYAYPVGVTEALIRFISDNPKICNYLDLPLQHISNPVLKTMRRPLGEKGTRQLIEKIRELSPELALRTTFVVGFPGEREADIAYLESFVSEAHFAHVGVFTYSQEEEAVSFHFDNQIAEEEKIERQLRIVNAQQAVVAKRLNHFVGKRLKVLLEGTHKDTDLLYSGRTEFQAPEVDGEVIINDLADDYMPALADIKGNFCQVLITEVAGCDLVGTLLGSDSALYQAGMGAGDASLRNKRAGIGTSIPVTEALTPRAEGW